MSESAHLRLRHTFNCKDATLHDGSIVQVWESCDILLSDSTFTLPWDYDLLTENANGLTLHGGDDYGYEYAQWCLSGLRKFEIELTDGAALRDPLDHNYGDLLLSIREVLALYDAGKVDNCGSPDDPVVYFKIW